MLGEIRKCPGISVVTVESTKQRHQEIILTAITQRAQQLFEERESRQGFELDDWLKAEKELWRDNDLNAPEFSLVVDCPEDPEVTTILSLTTNSLVVLRNRRRHAGEAICGPQVQSVYLFAQEVDLALTEVHPTNGTLRVCLPKSNYVTSR